MFYCNPIAYSAARLYTELIMKPLEYGTASKSPFSTRETAVEKKKGFQEQLAEVLLERFPGSKKTTAEEARARAATLAAHEASLEDVDLVATLKEYGIDSERLQIMEGGRYRLPVRNHFTQKRLPEGYAYKGGAARALLLRSLGIDPAYQPRDLDVVRLAPEPPSLDMDDWVAREFMPEDYAHGNGVETMASLDRYFVTRDFTINEVLASDTEVFASRECILDSVRHIIRLSEYERERIENGGPSDKMMAKALRTYAEAIHRWDDASLEGLSDWDYEECFVSPFWLALQLDRAFDVGSEVAESFTRELIRRRQIPEDIKSAIDAADYLLALLEGDSFYYRHAPVEQFNLERAHIEEDDYSHLTKQEGFGRRNRLSR